MKKEFIITSRPVSMVGVGIVGGPVEFTSEEVKLLSSANITITGATGFAREFFYEKRGFAVVKRRVYGSIIFQAFSFWQKEDMHTDSYHQNFNFHSLLSLIQWVYKVRKGEKEPEQLTIW